MQQGKVDKSFSVFFPWDGTYNAENKHGGLELSKQKHKDMQNSTNYQRM